MLSVIAVSGTDQDLPMAGTAKALPGSTLMFSPMWERLQSCPDTQVNKIGDSSTNLSPQHIAFFFLWSTKSAA